MSWHGAGWLTRDSREREEATSQMLKALNVQAGWTVCDFGCGNGYHTLPLAQQVGPKGKVFAVDIQSEMLAMLQKRAKQAGVRNVQSVLADLANPKLPPNSCDLILMVDVYHELGYPERILAALAKALKPEGRIALVEFRAEDPKVPIKALHKMSKKQILKEFGANQWQLDRSYDRLPWQHLMFFTTKSTKASQTKKSGNDNSESDAGDPKIKESRQGILN